MEHKKEWYESRTMWFNLITGAVGMASNMIMEGGLSPKMAAGLATFVMVGNLVLRALTSSPIK